MISPGRFFVEFFLGAWPQWGMMRRVEMGKIPGQTSTHGKLYPAILLPPDQQGGESIEEKRWSYRLKILKSSERISAIWASRQPGDFSRS